MDELVSLSLARISYSRLWRRLGNVWEELKESVNWVVRDGSQTNFWYDNWLNSTGRLTFICNLGAAPRPTMVSDMLTSLGEWDWDKLGHQLSGSVLEKLVVVPPPMPQYGADVPGWMWEEKRCFTLASTYKYLMREWDKPRDSKWRIIWSLRVPWLVQIFMWITAHNGAEDKCPKAQELWSKVLRPEVLKAFCVTPFDTWLIGNLQHRPRQEFPDFDWGRVEVETYNKEATSIVNRSSTLLASSALVHAIHSLLQKGWPVQVRHIPRGMNAVADKLAVDEASLI
ncbi:hypothetical protein V6N12_069686 [Hibiscus sabdariffa]|uniref:RNase H type-1 domain-containing protein n=1 Tax=Hibiscus sabdariffa TaxID=183260 RepID=A0ABR2FER7_9ROSI